MVQILIRLRRGFTLADLDNNCNQLVASPADDSNNERVWKGRGSQATTLVDVIQAPQLLTTRCEACD